LGGKSFDWPTRSGFLEGQLKTTSKEHSPVVTNVIALGMIQAETRRNVIETARWLDSLGIKVLALYADSIIVDGNSQLPFLPNEWRTKQSLNNLFFYDSVSWVADEDMRLPGRSGADMDRRARALARSEVEVKATDGRTWDFFDTAPSWQSPDKVFKRGALAASD